MEVEIKLQLPDATAHAKVRRATSKRIQVYNQIVRVFSRTGRAILVM